MSASRLVLYTIATPLVAIAVVGSVGEVVQAHQSQFKQDIFTVDCTSTTVHNGNSITTAYGCPEPPTIESPDEMVSQSPLVFDGWFDATNMQSLTVTFSNGTTYTLGVDPELTVVGDRWVLKLVAASEILPPGYYTMTVAMGATNGQTVSSSQQIHLTKPITPQPTLPHHGGDNGGGSVTPGGSSAGGGSSSGGSWWSWLFGGAAADTGGARSQHGSGDGRVVTDADKPFIEYFRELVMSYVMPSWIPAFLASILFFGYVFFLLGRHYRHLAEDHRNAARALKRASHRHTAPQRPVRHTTHRKKHA